MVRCFSAVSGASDLRFLILLSVSLLSAGAGSLGPVDKEGARAQPPATTYDSPHEQLTTKRNGNDVDVGELRQGSLLLLEREQEKKEQSQQGGPVAQGQQADAKADGAGAPSTAGLVANGAADLLRASREEHVRCTTSQTGSFDGLRTARVVNHFREKPRFKLSNGAPNAGVLPNIPESL